MLIETIAGYLYKPDTQDFGSLPCKTLPALCLPTFDAGKTNANDLQAANNHNNTMGHSYNYCVSITVSHPPPLEFNAEQMFQPSM